MVILFCDRCGQRITETEQKAGRVQINSEGIAICAKCTEAQAAARPPQDVRAGEAASRPTGAVLRPSATLHAERGARHTGRSPSTAGTSSSTKTVLIALAVVVASAIAITCAVVVPSRESTAGTQAAKANPPKGDAVVAQKSTAPSPSGGRTPAAVAAPRSTGVSPVAEPSSPKPAAPTPPKQEDAYDPRGEVAASLLAQAQAFLKANPDDVWTYRDKLETLKERYAGTAGGKEAARLFAEIKLPEVDPATNPMPPAESAWVRAVQVLPLVDPAKNRQNGNWSMAGCVLRSDKSMWARLALPYLLPEEYDLRLTFARVDDTDCLLVVLARRGRPFIFSVGGANNMGCSFETIKESRRDILPTKLSRPGVLSNNRRYQLVIQVRNKCLRAHLDGKPIVGCQVDDEGLSLAPELTTPRPNQLGLATWNSVS
ncbi:MAG: hypothetical protein NTW87_35680 [Planctomycetota bacterium]|nr:hypothetical protein [Planctomycetota bacterium]